MSKVKPFREYVVQVTSESFGEFDESTFAEDANHAIKKVRAAVSLNYGRHMGWFKYKARLARDDD